MKAMILAAGLGTRLRPLTNDRPKALVEVAGRTLLEMTLSRLRDQGVCDVIVNVHHFAEMIVDYLEANRKFGMHIEVSREELVLDTGGGLKKAAYFFLRDWDGGEEPFIVHNVDVISTIDLGRMVRFHRDHQALATLAVQHRETSRYLVFDEQMRLCGWRKDQEPVVEAGRPHGRVEDLAFSGIHLVSPRLLGMMSEEGAFSIIAAYLRLAASGERILGFEDDRAYWRDLGTPESVEAASSMLLRSRSSI
jgi:NDP-sugar pyrophosphorylase family protein